MVESTNADRMPSRRRSTLRRIWPWVVLELIVAAVVLIEILDPPGGPDSVGKTVGLLACGLALVAIGGVNLSRRWGLMWGGLVLMLAGLACGSLVMDMGLDTAGGAEKGTGAWIMSTLGLQEWNAAREGAVLMITCVAAAMLGPAMLVASAFKSPFRLGAGDHVFNVINAFLLILLSLLAIYPFIYTISMSLSSAAEASRGGLHLYPREISFTAYEMVFSNPEILSGYLNSILRTAVGTVLTLGATCLTAYPLSKRSLPHRKGLMFFFLFTMLFSGGIVPLYLVIKNLGLLNTRLVYVMPMMVTAFNVIIIKNFFQSVPEEMAESAAIDGASDWRTLFQIYMPLSKPVLATVGLWTAVMHWNMWFDALIYVTDDKKQVLQTFLRRIVIENDTKLIEKGLINPNVLEYTPDTIKAATVIITILPMLLLYPLVQRYFVKGIMLGSTKG